MATLNDLPKEILIYIIQKLDFTSCLALYHTSTYLRRILTMSNVINECNFSMSIYAKRCSLRLSLFEDISGHLLKLNLSQVSNLNSRILVPTLKNMRRLETLDVSYTPIKISDLIGVQEYCCNLKDIKITFFFPKYPIKIDVLEKCRDFFKNFKSVHFVGNPHHLIFSTIALRMLEMADLDTINFTVSDANDSGPPVHFNVRVESLRFKNFNIYLSHKHRNYFRTTLFLEETIMMKMINDMVSQFVIVCAEHAITDRFYSPAFEGLFKEENRVKCIEKIQEIPYGRYSIAAILFHKDNVFDDSMYKQVEKRLSKLPFTVRCLNRAAPPQYKWIWVNEEHTIAAIQRNKERRTCENNDFVLDYDMILSEHKEAELTIVFWNVYYVTAEIPQDCTYLKKITFLCLKGPIRCNMSFFTAILQNCVKMKTLSIISSHACMPALSLTQLLPLNKSLRNFRLVAKDLNLSALLKNLSECSNLENIYINNINYGTHPKPAEGIPNPCALFQNLPNLYNFALVANFPNYNLKREIELDIIKYKAQHNKSHLNVYIIHNKADFCFVPYHPSFEVFNETILKQI